MLDVSFVSELPVSADHPTGLRLPALRSMQMKKHGGAGQRKLSFVSGLPVLADHPTGLRRHDDGQSAPAQRIRRLQLLS